MDILGIGPLELLFIVIIALIVLGPKDMAKAGKTIGRYLRKVVKSDAWQAVQHTTKELRSLPNKLIREAGMEDEYEEFKSIMPDTNLKLPSWDDIVSDPNKTIASNSPASKTASTPETDHFLDWTTPPADRNISDPITPNEQNEK